MNLLKSCVIALAMYSKIPMPQFEWKEENMRYSLIFFPVVGLFIGGGQILLYWLLGIGELSIGGFTIERLIGGGIASGNHLAGTFPVGFWAAIAAIFPILVTGGIHMDGYCDTVDALASYQPREQRLRILKDSHAGAFAVIWAAAYFVLCYGGWHLIQNQTAVWMVALGYVGSRAMSGLAAVHFPAAKKDGTLYSFASVADRRAVGSVLVLVFVLVEALQIYLSVKVGLALLLLETALYGYYFRMSKKKFGGITGDLEGWFLQCEELLVLFVCGVGNVLTR